MRPAEFTLPTLLTNPRKAAVLSYAIRRTPPRGRDTTVFDAETCKKIVEQDFLPTPQEQAENLIRWLGANLPGPGEVVIVSFDVHGAVVGVQSKPGFVFVVNGLVASGLLEVRNMPVAEGATVTLSFAGWERFEQLRRGTPSGRKAFMAMEYGNPILDRLVNDHFRVAVKETGFDLRRLDDEPRAGLIDDRLRVEIQSSRFLIVDLTHRNAGAYWEAGYAEGLGKPVIYTCEESKFEEVSHFDTNHHLHVLWSENDLDAAAKRLKTTIRATIPEATRE
jgi:hypothetical protein